MRSVSVITRELVLSQMSVFWGQSYLDNYGRFMSRYQYHCSNFLKKRTVNHITFDLLRDEYSAFSFQYRKPKVISMYRRFWEHSRRIILTHF
jgi:hypothetical protein